MQSAVLPGMCLLLALSPDSARLAAQVVDEPKWEHKPVDLDKFLNPGQTSLGPAQRKAAILHQVSAFYRAADLNRDGEVSSAEIAALEKQAAEDAQEYQNDERTAFGQRQATPVEVYESHLIEEPAVSFKPNPWGLQIRRTLDDVSPAVARNASPADKFKAAKPAEIGFTSNGETDNDSYMIRGVIARPFGTPFGYWMPSAQIDRVGNSDGTTKDVNSLILGATAAWIPQTPEGFLRYQEYRFGLRHATDFDFDPGLSGVEVQYRPFFKLPSNGIFEPILGSRTWQYRTHQWLHVESGLDDRDDAVEDDYFRAGGAVGIELVPGLERLLLSAEYRYYGDLLGHEDGDYDNFKATAAWRLDADGNFVIQASYENGMVPLSFEDIDLFSFGIGVKY